MAGFAAEGGEDVRVVGYPFGEPFGAVVERVRGVEDVEANRAGGELLLPDRLGAEHRCREHGEAERGAGEAVAFGVDLGLRGIRVGGGEDVGGDGTELQCALAPEDFDAPGGELAVVGHSRRDGEDLFEFVGGGGWTCHVFHGSGAAGEEWGE